MYLSVPKTRLTHKKPPRVDRLGQARTQKYNPELRSDSNSQTFQII